MGTRFAMTAAPLVALALTLTATAWCDHPAGDATSAVAVADRPRVVIVKPVILCDDDGSHPAPHTLPKTLVDQVYTKAGLEFIYLEPVHWNHGKARRGEINLDQIVRQGRQSRIICRDPHVVTLVFVTAIDGQPGPMGRGQQDGNICFVALGPKGKELDPEKQAFVVAHEVGHCLNLKHIVDDPAVPNDTVNLQGEGAFGERLSAEGLHDSQRDTVLKSPLVLDRIQFHSVKEGRELIVDESWEPYITKATDDFLRFCIGLKVDAPIPQQPAARMALAKQQFAEKVLEFTDAEKVMVTDWVQQLKKLTGKQWPLVSRLPWHFLKVDSSFCSGFPHTRGLSILLPDRALQGLARNEKSGMSLLLHEKLHVIQRLCGPRFKTLYQDYGFHPIQLAKGELSRAGVAQNPDAFELNWAIQFGQKTSSVVTLFKAADNRLRFASQYRLLDPQGDGTFTFGEVIDKNEDFRSWQRSFGMNSGLEHPNETSAYLSGKLFALDFMAKNKTTLSEPQLLRLDQTRKAFEQIMRIDGE